MKRWLMLLWQWLRRYVPRFAWVGDRSITDATHALAYAESIAASAPTNPLAYVWVNAGVTALVTGGLYREALAFPDRWSTEMQQSGRAAAHNQWALVQINLAEAEYNLGRIDEAARRMDQLAQLLTTEQPFGSIKIEPIIPAGLACQQAWIAALLNQPDRGLELHASVDKQALPEQFRTEVDYTKALLLAKAGRMDEAESLAEHALTTAIRPSSERNGLFLIGIILADQGKHIAADRAFERGAAHHYKGQGGDALLRWGQVLQDLKRPHQSQQAYKWCIERDPQSPAAETARSLLVAGTGPSSVR